MQAPTGGAAAAAAASASAGGSLCLLFSDLDAGTRYCEERFLEVRTKRVLAAASGLGVCDPLC